MIFMAVEMVRERTIQEKRIFEQRAKLVSAEYMPPGAVCLFPRQVPGIDSGERASEYRRSVYAQNGSGSGSGSGENKQINN